VFDAILIANRGEIACRIIRTARRLGVRSVAVYSDADSGSMHVRMADAAYRLGGASARESYLNVDALLAAARRSGAQAVHPGYGFLAENADFARACAQAGLEFIGPPPEAIHAMGSKIGAKQLMERAGVPIVPGYHSSGEGGSGQDDATLSRAADAVGYPILIKASAGGGGKGMRIVRSAAELPAALAGARREALKAFGDDRVLLERYLIEPRHIEVQVFADKHGGCIHLNERDCSIQRRHQKIIEEAPAPGMTAQRRAAMGDAATCAARSVGYVGAGTVEFIASGDDFFFMEMNTRLQVEHPVTEMITGLDLVEWQLRIAAGERLPATQEQVAPRGHAIEARIYAEDPARDFVPSTGVIEHLRWPAAANAGDAPTRIDTGVEAGDEITVHYDPMIAKLIVFGRDRATAARRMAEALARCEIAGVTTNLALLQAIARHPQFAAGAVHTGFIPLHESDLFRTPDAAARARLIGLAVAGWLLRGPQPATAWSARDGWHLNLPARLELALREGDRAIAVTAQPQSLPGTATAGALADNGMWSIAIAEREIIAEGGSARSTTGSQPVEVTVAACFDADGRLDARVDGTRVTAGWLEHGGALLAFAEGQSVRLAWDDHSRDVAGEGHGGGLRSPMPGQVLQVLTSVGATVKRHQPLMIVEAMKMEHTIVAPSDGVVEAILHAAGDRVAEGDQLLRIKSAD